MIHDARNRGPGVIHDVLFARKQQKTTSWVFVVLVPLVLGFGLPAQSSAQDAIRTYEQSCTGGQFAACAILGLMYEQGAGVAADPARAAVYYDRACAGGETHGCTNLGLLYQAGKGVSRDLERAAQLFTGSCDAGEPLACDLQRDVDRTAAAEQGGYYTVGRVQDASTGRALDEAVIDMPARGLQIVSDSTGRVEFGRLPAGRYAVVAERFGYERVDGQLEVPGNAEFLILLPPAHIEDPLATGRLVGRVSDRDQGGGLADVEIAVEGGAGARILSRPNGSFELRGLRPGLVNVTFSRLGYGQRTTTVVMQPGGSVELSVGLSTRPVELAGVDVVVPGGFLDRVGFSERATMGRGTYFTEEDIQRLAPTGLSDLLRGRVPGVRIEYGVYLDDAALANSAKALAPGGGGRAQPRAVPTGPLSRINGRDCVLSLVVDGAIMPYDVDLDFAVPPEQIEAVEVYSRINVPVEFAGQSPCGVILIWTKR